MAILQLEGNWLWVNSLGNGGGYARQGVITQGWGSKCPHPNPAPLLHPPVRILFSRSPMASPCGTAPLSNDLDWRQHFPGIYYRYDHPLAKPPWSGTSWTPMLDHLPPPSTSVAIDEEWVLNNEDFATFN